MFENILNLLHRYILVPVIRRKLFMYKGKGKRVQQTERDNTILRCSAVQLAAMIRRKEVTSVQVLHAFIDRINATNILLRCVVDQRYEEALEEAASADQTIASDKHTEQELERDFPFLGVPFSTKDHIAVKGMLFTAGVVARKDIRATEDSDTVALMRKAGAIPIVLTNVSELCLAWESFNRVHGRTSNPYDTNRTPGGSAGGEGCLLTACGSPLGLGSDLGGSIRVPALFNGVFGHKPSSFVVSTSGIFPPADEPVDFMATIGPMSRFAEDLLPAMRVLSGDMLAELRLDDPVDITEVKVFYQLTDDGGSPFVSKVDEDIRSAIKRAIDHFQGICVQSPKPTHIKELQNASKLWWNNLASVDIAALLTNSEGRVRPWTELMKWTVGRSKHTLQSIIHVFNSRHVVTTAEQTYWDNRKLLLANQFETMLGKDGVFVYPTHPTVAPYHSEPIARFHNLGYTSVFNVLGLPSTSIPMGLGREGLPVGLQVVANRNEDRLCLAVARELEKVFGGWIEPGANV